MGLISGIVIVLVVPTYIEEEEEEVIRIISARKATSHERKQYEGTFLATFQAIAAKYPNKSPVQILHDLVESTPGQEGK